MKHCTSKVINNVFLITIKLKLTLKNIMLTGNKNGLKLYLNSFVINYSISIFVKNL